MESRPAGRDRKSTRLNSSHTVIYTLSLHDALPISAARRKTVIVDDVTTSPLWRDYRDLARTHGIAACWSRSEEHTSELQSHSDLHSFPTRRSSDLGRPSQDGHRRRRNHFTLVARLP